MYIKLLHKHFDFPDLHAQQFLHSLCKSCVAGWKDAFTKHDLREIQHLGDFLREVCFALAVLMSTTSSAPYQQYVLRQYVLEQRLGNRRFVSGMRQYIRSARNFLLPGNEPMGSFSAQT